ncbi:unnamed protein product [Staurois parvus]|uniref:Uncharacterized protein n=1 Tax=Staurois parvus TaxID=386267 RepID=A0ABN9B946_9NEOB|nr:unnamed protein product [Staurois parvus]
MKGLTQLRSRIPVLSVGNVFQGSPIFINIRELIQGGKAVFLS